MEANPRKLYDLLFAGNQFVIPVFQRKYVWKKPNWERLWDDIEGLQEDGGAAHFMGSIVTAPYKTEPGTIPQYIVIDGQQRLITLVTLLAAIRDEARVAAVGTLPDQIQKQYLVHEFGSGDTRFKVFPRLLDRDAYFALVEGEPQVTDGSGMTDAYRFFRAQISGAKTADMARYVTELFAAVTQRLAFVSITLDAEQNPWAIFETLNARGVVLKQSDLIRNHMFMKVPLGEQDDFDDKHWRAFEQLFEAGEDAAAIPPEDFYRDFLMRNGGYVRPETTYLSFQADPLVKSTPSVELTFVLSAYLRCYSWIHRPRTAPDKSLTRELSRLRQLSIGATYPLVLDILWRYSQDELSGVEAARCVQAISAFYIRRAVCGWSAGGYYKSMPAAIPMIDASDVVGSLTRYLAARGWPTNDEFERVLLDYPLYRRFLRVARVMLLALEDPDAHKENVDVEMLLDKGTISIEHVMPQTIRDDEYGMAWQAMLGEDWQADKERWLHAIGNLTLTGYNTPLSNRPYAWKREEFAKSHLGLNDWFATREAWDAVAIEQRGTALTQRVVELWPSAGVFDASAAGIAVEDLESKPSLTGAQLEPLYIKFWQGMDEHLKSTDDHLTLRGTDTWYRSVDPRLRWAGTYVVTRGTARELVVQVEARATWSPTVFNFLQMHRDRIEQGLGPRIDWLTPEGSDQRKLEVKHPLDLSAEAKWPEYYEWLRHTINALHDALVPLLGLNLPRGEQQAWSEKSFFEELATRCPSADKPSRRLIESLVTDDFCVSWGDWAKTAVMLIDVPTSDSSVRIARLYADNSVSVHFNNLKATEAFASDDSRHELLSRLNAIRPFELPESVIVKEPYVPLMILDDPETRASFLELLKWVRQRLLEKADSSNQLS